MRVLLTGTGAADGVPAFFADSELSRHARAEGGKDIRLRASAVVDGDLRIDFGADTYAQCALLRVSPAEWRDIVFTHSHNDHFAPLELQYLLPPFRAEEEPRPAIWGNQAVLEGLVGCFEGEELLERRMIRSFETRQVGSYEVTPIRAYHKLDEDSLNLIVRKGEKTLLYAADTGVYEEETWRFLEGWRFDCAVIECTDGFNPADYWGHLSCEELVGVVGRLREMGCLADGAQVCTTHHAHTGLATHGQLEEFLAPHGIQVGYDGMSLDI